MEIIYSSKFAREYKKLPNNIKYRIIFDISKDKNTVHFHAVGDHDIYQ
ncbi:MAG: hypothetical protein Q8P62_01555 [Candidatus Peregrinibacteria bacterium]|nr:hypothetical protein [Candidatus Peregrinibacteria bacterium]